MEELKKIKDTTGSISDLFESLNELADYVDKLVVVDADLHSRITDLMIEVTNLTKEMKVVSDLLRKALNENNIEEKHTKPASKPMNNNVPSSNPVDEIHRLREENERLLKQLSDLENIYRERNTREMLKKALEKHYGGIQK